MERTILPNATLFPNFLTDEVMPLVSSDEWKVIHFGVVACLRLDRGDDSVGIAQFVQGTGLSEDRVRDCLAFLCDTAQIFLRQDRPRKPQAYRLNHEISAVQVETLEQRKKGAPVDVSGPDAEMDGRESGDSPVDRDAAAPAVRGRGRVAEPFPEHPSVEIRLDGEEGPVTKRMRQTLPAPERAAFDHLLRHYPRAKREGEDSEVWGLFRLWQTYGFACLNNALQGAHAATDLSEVNRICLLDEITKLYEQEVGLATPGLHEELARLASDFPSLAAWQEAFRIAIKLNKRRLSTVETILRNQRQKSMEEVTRPASRPRRKAALPPAGAPAEPAAAGSPREV
jgi:hypothetical protein